MKKGTLHILIKWLYLPQQLNLKFNTEYGIINYTIKQISPLDPDHILNSILKLKKEIKNLKENEKKIIQGFNDQVKKEYNDRNPLCLITIEDIPLKKEHTKEIPSFLDNRVQELIHSLSFIFAAPIKPLFFIYMVEGEKGLMFRSSVDGLNKKGYDKYFKVRDVKSLFESFLPELMFKQRRDDNLKLCLILYKITLEMPGKLRIVFYWTMLEMFAGQGFKEVYSMVSKYLNVDKNTIEKYYEMRNRLVHSGRTTEKYDYNKESEEFGRFIQDVVLAMLKDI